jgi:hypothetical protein
MNCRQPVDPEKAQVFLGVYVCETCHLVASRLRARIQDELKALLTMSDEALRIGLIEGKVVLGPAEAGRELTKREVLQQVVKLSEVADATKSRARPVHGHPGDTVVVGTPDRSDVR